MSLTHEQVRHVAHLARLSVSPEAEERLARQLGAILGYVERLQSLDVTGVPPMAHSVAANTPERPDVLGESLPLKAVLAQAPLAVGEGVAVPRVIE
jgi:aspartyl-tRNA(Asn)/glutamyl-tRNA(Gln) amidotransferase subunit C